MSVCSRPARNFTSQTPYSYSNIKLIFNEPSLWSGHVLNILNMSCHLIAQSSFRWRLWALIITCIYSTETGAEQSAIACPWGGSLLTAEVAFRLMDVWINLYMAAVRYSFTNTMHYSSGMSRRSWPCDCSTAACIQITNTWKNEVKSDAYLRIRLGL